MLHCAKLILTQAQFPTPITRVYFDKMDNGGVRALAAAVSRRVSLVTQSLVPVGSWSFDGAHRSLIDDSAQALAHEANSDAGALVTNPAGLCDAPGAGTVGTNGAHEDRAANAAQTGEEQPDLQSKLGKAMATRILVDRTIELLSNHPFAGPSKFAGNLMARRALNPAGSNEREEARTGVGASPAAQGEGAAPCHGARLWGLAAFTAPVALYRGRLVTAGPDRVGEGEQVGEGEVTEVNELDHRPSSEARTSSALPRPRWSHGSLPKANLRHTTLMPKLFRKTPKLSAPVPLNRFLSP